MPGSITIRMALTGADGVRQSLKDIGNDGGQAGANIQKGMDAGTGAMGRQSAAAEALSGQLKALGASGELSAKPKSAQASAAVFQTGFRDMEAQAAALRDRLDPAAAAQRKLGEETGRLSGLLKSGAISQAEYAAGVKLAETALAASTKGVHANAGAIRGGLVLLREIGRGDFTRLGGSATIELQRLGLLETLLNPVALGIGAVAAAAIGAAIAFDRWQESQNRIATSLRTTGARSGATVTQINAIAEQVSSHSAISGGDARGAALGFADAGLNPDQIRQATQLVAGFAVVTGQKAPDAAKALAAALQEPGKGAEALNEKLHFLTAAQIEHIKALVEQGNKTAATTELLNAFGAQSGVATAKLTGLSAVIGEVGKTFDGASNAVGRYIAVLFHVPDVDPVKRLAAAQATLARINALNPVQKALLSPGDIKKQTDEAVAAIAESQKTIASQAGRTKLADLSDRSKNFGDAVDAIDPQRAQIKTLQDYKKNLENNLNNPEVLASKGITRADAVADLASADKQIAALEKARKHIDEHAASQERDAAAMRVSAAEGLKLAAAYLQSDSAAQQAEARRKATTDGTRKGVDVEARTAAQLDLSRADVAVAGAKKAAQLRDEAEAQDAVNKAVAAGNLDADQARQAMEKQLALAPILAAMDGANAEQLKVYRAEVVAITQAFDRLNASKNVGTLDADIAKQADDLAEARAKLAVAGLAPDQKAGAERLTQAHATLDRLHIGADDPRAKTYLKNAQTITDTDRQAAAQDFTGNKLRDQQASLDLISQELQLGARNAAQREQDLAMLQAKAELQKANVSAESAEGQAIIANAQRQVQLNQALARQQSTFDELKSAGENLLDIEGKTVSGLSNGWGVFKSSGLEAINAVIQAMLKLALINPEKNALFGENLPTLGSAGGLGGLFSHILGQSGNPFTTPIQDFMPPSLLNLPGFGLPPMQTLPNGMSLLPGYSTGIDDAPGGYATVGEQGRERVYLPPHARILSNVQTRMMEEEGRRARDNLLYGNANGMGSGSGGGAGFNGDIHVHNQTGVPMKATASTGPNGDIRMVVVREFKDGLRGVSQSGDLERAIRNMPNTRKFRP